MLQTRVVPFIKVIFSHDYYRDGSMKGLQIVPTPLTVNIMRKTGLFGRQRGNEYQLGYTVGKTNRRLEDDDEVIPLVFSLNTTNANFQSISEVPLYLPGEKVFYFTNREKTKSTAEKPTSLTTDESPTVGVQDLYQVRGTLLSLTAESGKIKVGLPTGKTIAQSEEASNGKSVLQVNLSRYAPDLLTVETEGNEPEKFYCAGARMNFNFGMLHLCADKGMLSADTTKAEQPLYLYRVHFEARKVFFRYYFLSERINEMSDIKITHSEFEISFTASAEKKTLTDGSTALAVISDRPLPLLEVRKGSFQASFIRDSESGRRINITLPDPDPGRIRGEGRGEKQKLFSDVYVYV